jgi:amino acid adenylation domain-containing protein
MTDVLTRLQGLSPERRRLLELRLKSAQAQAAGPELRPRERAGNTAPLSFAQARLWVLDRMSPGSAAYNMPYPLRIRGAVDVDALAGALDALRERHETLRTTVAERADGPVQVIHPPEPVPLPAADLSHLAADEREDEVRRRVDEDANTGFDLVEGPLLRASLLALGADEHVLLVCMHHIVSDGWSMGVIARELGELYAAAREGRPARLEPLPVQYADFAAWQREHLAGEALARLTAFWRGQLEGAPPALELPDRVRPPAESHRGRTVRTRIEPAAAERLRELARGEEATLFNLLTAAFRAVLARHAGQDDVVIGTPVANRQRSELEGLVGFFVNTLPLRLAVDPAESFRGLLAREKAVALAAFDHQELPFDRLVEELRLPRDPARNPVFQAMVTLQNARMEPVALGGVEIAPLAPEYQTAKFDLTLDNYEEDDGGLRLDAEYATDLFDAPTVERIVRHVLALLDDAVEMPDRPLAELPGAGPAERAFVLRAVNHTAAEYERDVPVHRVFEARLARTPHAVAVEFGDVVLSYAQLHARAAALAGRLRAAGIGAEARVGLAMERSAELVVAMLGTLMAGAAYVPLDPAYPLGRLAFMVANAGVGALVVRGELPDALAGFGGPVIAISSDDPAAPDPGDAGCPDVGGDALAYVVYTSGSTGTPKAIGIPHRAVVRLVRNTAYVPFARDERIAQLSNASFDALTFEVWGALLNGGAVVGIDRDTVLDPDALAEAIREKRVTTAFLTVALFNQVARARPAGFGSMRHLLVGGEALEPSAVRAVLAAGPPRRLLNGYGPSESTTFATWHLVDHVPAEAASVPIGLPLANTTAYVLDGSLRPCGLGETGELYLGGDGLARGYLGRRGMTAERFVPDALGAAAGARLYRTGDRVRRREDGALEFLARADQQVKVRGFRIEPGEVEAALRDHPDVRDCTVAVREDGGEKRLVAYVVARNGSPPSAAALRDALGRRLPDYMVPTAFVALDAIPLTPNGKVDRAALPAPDAPDAEETSAPRTAAQELLAGIWGAVLGLEKVGIDDDFFLLGGHSLLATQVVSRIRQAFGAEVPLRAVFEAPTVRRLAARVEALRADGDPLPPVTPADRSRPLPLSFAQERMWFLERLEPDAGIYNMPVALRLAGPLDAEALRGALETVVHRHEALRTRIRPSGDGRVQDVAGPRPFELPVVDAAGEDEARQMVHAHSWRPFDLEHGPVLRALLVRLSADDHLFALNLHHAMGDGWSLGILFRELSAAYAALARGEAPALPPVPLQYADFAAWQREHLAGERLDRELAYWRGRLEGAPPLLELPSDRPRPPRQSFRGAAVPLVLPLELAGRVRALSRREGATPFMVLLAAWQALLGRLANQDDVVVGTAVAGRSREETEGIVGLFVNTLALRADLSGDPSFRALLAQVREATLGAFAHQDLPFEKLVEQLKVERSLSHPPLFQAMFALQNQGNAELEFPGVASVDQGPEQTAAKFELTLNFEEVADGAFAGTLEYAADLFDHGTAERIAARYRLLLEGVLADAGRPIAQVEVLAPGERERLAAWSDGGPAAEPIAAARMFEAWVERAPHAVAVDFQGEETSYAELNRRANRLARHLRSIGVGPESVVAISLERSAHPIAAVLAVWKAGGAYLPVDPDYPVERRAYMLADSRAQVLVTRHALAAGLDTAAARVVDLDEAYAAAEGEDDTDLGVANEPEGIAYVIYTSGSTGRPKGALVTHGGLHNMAAAQREAFGMAPGTRLLQFVSFSFDVAMADILATLGNGCTLVMATRESLLPGKPLLSTLAERRVNAVLMPPSVWSVLPEAGLPELRTVSAGGEALPPDVVARWSRGRRLVNAYGPTEATVYATFARLQGEMARVPLGVPLQGTRVHVVDRAFHESAIGVPGEIWVGGAGVARGYLGRPGLTADRFVPDPFSGRPGGRLYRTGDLGRWNPNRTLDYLGRIDHQVKVRGFRVEPGEVEAALAALPGVRDALVALRVAPAGDRRLVGYVASSEADLSPVEMRAALRRVLPAHMVPAELVVLERFPLTPNGKVDRRALPEPAWGSAQPRNEGPRTPTEAAVAAVWREVLGIEEVGRGDDFFAAGGHSLLAGRVAARLRRAVGIELPLREIFDAPTLEALAARIDVELARAVDLPAPPIVPVPRDRPLPLSFAQERLWFVHQLHPEAALYNMPVSLRLRGALDVEALRRALDEIVRRHEPLRTVFRRGEAGPVQVILPPSSVPLPRFDLAGRADAEAEARRIADEDARAPFDLETGPLLRLALLRRADDDHTLLIDMHHVVSDGWSMGRFHAELAALYAAFAAGEASPLPELPVQYADFAAWQRGWLRGEVLERQLGYWKSRLAGAPALELPADHPRPPVPGVNGAGCDAPLPADAVARLEEAAREEGATPFMAMLAVGCALLHRWTGQHDIVVGTVAAGRTRAETEALIGFFVNTLPLRTDLSGDPTFRALLRRVRQTTLEAYAHQELPFEKLVDELKVERSPSRPPLVQVRFMVQDEAPGTRAAGLSFEPGDGGDTGTSKLDLTFGVVRSPGGRVRFSAEYSADLFDAATIERLAEDYHTLLAAAAESPDAPLSELLGAMDGDVPRRARVEPGEVAALLRAVDGVRDAAVVVRGEGPFAGRQVAYVVLGPAAPGTEALLEQLKARLPEYRVPSAMVTMDELPLDPNGELDRAALPEPAPAAAEAAQPRGELERAIAGAWREVLGVDAVGVNDNFFEIGGHSLLLALLHEKLEGALGRELQMVDLFRSPTVRSFAALVGEHAEAQPRAAQRGEDRGSARRAARVGRR